MLDAHARFAALDPDGLDIYWGAYLGTPDELLVARTARGGPGRDPPRARGGAGAQGLDLRHLPAAATVTDGERRVLILGGTARGTCAGRAARRPWVPVISSLAGRVARPRLPVGADAYRRLRRPRRAGSLARRRAHRSPSSTRPIRSPSGSRPPPCRPPRRPCRRSSAWIARAGAPDRRTTGTGSTTFRSARAQLDALGRGRVLLTSGRQGLQAFTDDAARWYLVRCVDPPDRVTFRRRTSSCSHVAPTPSTASCPSSTLTRSTSSSRRTAAAR